MKKREKLSKTVFILFIFFLIWVLVQFLAPLSLEKSSVKDLSGLTGFEDNKEVTEDMSTPWNLVYKIGDRLCHQKADRSFFINGNQMPFCARCTAIWIGLVIGIGFLLFYKLKLDEKFILLILFGLIPVGIDGVAQFLGLWESTNFIRLITGLLAGFVCGLAIVIIIEEILTINLIKKNKN